MRALALCVVLALAAGCSSGQANVKGLVRDRDTGSPISGALVQLEGVPQTTTDLGGLYSVTVKRSRDPVAIYVEARGYFKFSEFRAFQDEEMPVFLLNFELVPNPNVKDERKR